MTAARAGREEVAAALAAAVPTATVPPAATMAVAAAAVVQARVVARWADAPVRRVELQARATWARDAASVATKDEAVDAEEEHWEQG